VRVGPGTLAGRFLRRFWHPVCLPEEIERGRTRREQLMGEYITLYRGESGRIHAVADRCAHRGTQLSVGWVEGDCIRCFYHGWKYDGTGQCVEQPAERAGFAAKIRIRSYPVQAYLGLVFLYLGEGEAPELPRYPELEDESAGTLVAAARASVPCNFFQRVENAVDQVHVAFAHRDVFGLEGVPEIPDYRVEETSYGLCAHGRRKGKQERLTHFHMPNINVMRVPPGKGEVGWAPNIVWRVPVDDTHHRTINVRRVRKAPDAAEPAQHYYRREATDRQVAVAQAILAGRMRLDQLDPVADRDILVSVQDNVAQIGQGPIAPRAQDHLGQSDVGVIAVRKLWRAELEALAAGRPLRSWHRPAEGVVMTSGTEKEKA
jgi:5,5'-dehydrodivanillate O-demethylase